MATFASLAVLAVVAVLLSLSWSSVSIPVDQVLAILIGEEADKRTWETIVMDIRLPRVLTAILVGTGLGLAGLQMQTVFRNPLASPFTLGVSSGASLGVALVILVSPASAEIFTGVGNDFFANLGTVAGGRRRRGRDAFDYAGRRLQSQGYGGRATAWGRDGFPNRRHRHHSDFLFQ